MHPSRSPWQPTQDGLEQVLGLIRMTDAHTSNEHRVVYHKLQEMQTHDEFCAYCAIIFESNQHNEMLRRQVGLVMKQVLRTRFAQIPQWVIEISKRACLTTISDQSRFVRRTSASIISALIEVGDLEAWPDLVPTLLNLLEKAKNEQHVHAADGILFTIEVLIDAAPQDLADDDVYGGRLVEALLYFATQKNVSFTRICLGALYNLFSFQANALVARMPKYAKILLELMDMEDDTVRREICESIIHCMNEYWENFVPDTQRVFEFFLAATEYNVDEVAIHAGEFWALYAMDRNHKSREPLVSILPKLGRVLMSKIRYTEEQLANIDFEKDNSNHVERAEDLKPVFFKNRAEEREDDMGDDDGIHRQEDDEETSWNIRKCCARQLDKLASQPDLLPKLLNIVVPIIKQQLDSTNFIDNEGGLLALGALCRPGYDFLEPNLHELIPFIISKMKLNNHMLVQAISCWTVARFSRWFMTPQGEPFLQPVLEHFITCLLGPSKRVQRAACSGLATFLEVTAPVVTRFLKGILEQFVKAFDLYQLKNLPHLIDVVIVMIHSLHKHTPIVLQTPEVIDYLCNPIMSKWFSFETNDTQAFPCYEALMVCCAKMGQTERFSMKYAPEIFKRCTQVAARIAQDSAEYERMLEEARAERRDEDFELDGDRPNKEFWASSLDLLTALCEGNSPLFHDFVKTVPDAFVNLLINSLKEDNFGVRRSAFSLLGDVINVCGPLLSPRLAEICQCCVTNVNPDYTSVCINASWCIGQAAQIYKAEILPFTEEMIQQLVGVLNHPHSQRSLKENCAITLARVAEIDPQKLNARLPTLQEWIKALTTFREDEEKVRAFFSLLTVVQLNPTNSVAVVDILFHSLCLWENPPAQLVERIRLFFQMYKSYANDWEGFKSKMSHQVQMVLAQRYHL